MKKIFLYSITLALLAIGSGCKKDYLETNPSNQVSNAIIFSTTDGAFTAMDGVYRSYYTSLTNHGNFGQKSYDLVSDLMGNDMVVHTQGYGWFNAEYNYTAQLLATDNSRSERMWWFYYRAINNANQIIVNIDGATGPQADKDNIKGQALALRAFSYYNLVNWFQQTYKGNENKPGVPIYTTPTSEGGPRASVEDVYKQVVADLTEAENLLTGKARKHISHINANVVQGIMARVALSMEDYSKAASYANKARTGHAPMSAEQYKQGFSKMTDGNPEWLWGVEIITDQATIYASFYSHMDVATGGYAALGGQKKITKALYDQMGEADVRREVFQKPGTGTSAYPEYTQRKLRVPTPGSWAADYLLMRSGEMYLIEAEALARSNSEAQAITVLETLIRTRDANYSAAGLSGTALIDEILLQRRIELWGEGFGLMDIKRLKQPLARPSGAGNHGIPNFNPGIFTLQPGEGKFLMRIPQREIDANPNIDPSDQNPS